MNFWVSGERYDEYKRVRNRCTQLKNALRKKYEDKLAVDAVTAPKRLYAYPRRRTKSPRGIPQMGSSDRLVDTSEAKAQAFAQHYARVNQSKEVPPVRTQTLGISFTTTYKPPTFQPDRVLKELKQLNVSKSEGPDGIHPIVLKELAEGIALALPQLFRLSFNSGRLPREWKEAVICPIYKRLGGHTYEQRLSALDMFSREFRRLKGDLITLRKSIVGRIGSELQQHFPLKRFGETR